MAFIFPKDRVRENSTTTGTTDFALSGAQSGFIAFNDNHMTNGDTTPYAAIYGAEWEVGIGTWVTGGTLERTTIKASSNGGAKVTFSAGTKDIFNTVPSYLLALLFDSEGLANPPISQCILTKSSSNLLLSRSDRGRCVFINGRMEVIPSSGPTLAVPSMTATMTIATPGVVTFNNHGLIAGAPIIFNTSGALPTGVTAGTVYYVNSTGLTANTFQFSATAGGAGAAVNTSGSQSGTHKLTGPSYYIYAYMSAGVLTLEASLTVPAADTTYGHQIKTGDATRSLVGLATPVNEAWVDSATQRCVRSWFNDPGILGERAFTAARSTAETGSFAKINAEIDIYFTAFANEIVRADANGMFYNSGGNTTGGAIGFDGVADGKSAVAQYGATTNAFASNSQGSRTAGLHYASVFGLVNGGTGTWDTVFGNYTSLRVRAKL